MRLNRNIVLFALAMAFLGCAGGIFETTSNNYYAQTFDITAEQRGDLELPREFPGFMVAVFVGVSFLVAEATLGVLAAALIAAGMFGLAAFANQPHQYANMIVFLMLWSTGVHLMMPVGQSLALSLAHGQKEGEKLGHLGRVSSVATIAGCGIVWVYFGSFEGRFQVTFLLGACIAAAAAVTFFMLRRGMPPVHHGPRPRFVAKRRYWLFYLLSILFGARKQIFITFGPWVLIRIYDQEPETFAKLWIISTVLGALLLPTIGRVVDRFGERAVLTADAAVLLFVCLAYGFAGDVLPHEGALLVACTAYVLDHFLFGLQFARATYLSKIAESRKDISGTLGLGVSLNHAVSIPIAMLGGRLWGAAGSHRAVFLLAGCVALVTMAACRFIRVESVEAGEHQTRSVED